METFRFDSRLTFRLRGEANTAVKRSGVNCTLMVIEWNYQVDTLCHFFPALYLKDSKKKKKKTIRVHRIKQYNVLVNIYLDQIYVVLFLFSRPPTSFPWFTSPLKALRHIIWGRYKWYIIGFLIFLLIVSLIAFFIYAAPVSESYLTDPSSQRAVSVCKLRQAHCCRL